MRRRRWRWRPCRWRSSSVWAWWSPADRDQRSTRHLQQARGSGTSSSLGGGRTGSCPSSCSQGTGCSPHDGMGMSPGAQTFPPPAEQRCWPGAALPPAAPTLHKQVWALLLHQPSGLLHLVHLSGSRSRRDRWVGLWVLVSTQNARAGAAPTKHPSTKHPPTKHPPTPSTHMGAAPTKHPPTWGPDPEPRVEYDSMATRGVTPKAAAVSAEVMAIWVGGWVGGSGARVCGREWCWGLGRVGVELGCGEGGSGVGVWGGREWCWGVGEASGGAGGQVWMEGCAAPTTRAPPPHLRQVL